MSKNGFWRVRVGYGGGMLHFNSSTEPTVAFDEHGRVKHVAMTPLVGGDIPGFIDWPAMVAVSWRYDENRDNKRPFQ